MKVVAQSALPSTTLSVKSLPARLRAALREVGYTRIDIRVRCAESAALSRCGATGRRGFAFVIQRLDDQDAGDEKYWGAWGGPSAFSSASPVDDIRAPDRPIPVGGAIITGEIGGRTIADVYVAPATFVALTAPSNVEAMAMLMVASDAVEAGARPGIAAKLVADALKLAAPQDPLSPLHHRVLDVFYTLKSFARPDALTLLALGGPAWSRITPAPGKAAVDAAIEHLIGEGYLRRAVNGATAMTTKGRAANESRRSRRNQGEIQS